MLEYSDIGGIMDDTEFKKIISEMTKDQIEIFIDLLSEHRLLPERPYQATPSADPLIGRGKLQ